MRKGIYFLRIFLQSISRNNRYSLPRIKIICYIHGELLELLELLDKLLDEPLELLTEELELELKLELELELILELELELELELLLEIELELELELHNSSIKLSGILFHVDKLLKVHSRLLQENGEFKT